VKGRAELIENGPLFEQVLDRLADLSRQMALPPVQYVVRITVESVWDMGPGPTAGERLA